MKRRFSPSTPMLFLAAGWLCLATGAPGCTKNGSDKPAAPAPVPAGPVTGPSMTPGAAPAPAMTTEATPVPSTVGTPPGKPADPVAVVKTPLVAEESHAQEISDSERTCSTDADCTFAPDFPCWCPSCKPTPRKAINRKTAQKRLDFYARARFDCEPCPAPRCDPQWIGRTVACRKGLCTTVP